MSEREELERQIRELLTADLDSIALSNRLFQQETGLFARLGRTEEQRRVLVQTELFRTALNRVGELQYRDAEALGEAVRVLRERLPDTDVRLSLDAPVRTAT